MKNVIAAAVMSAAIATPALAQKQLLGEVVKVVPDAREVAVRVPDTRCEIADVPIYGGGGDASTFDKLGGAIIGGAIGNQFGGGSGKDALTVLGAIVGADVASNRMQRPSQIIGYRQEKICTTEYTVEYQQRTYGYDVTVQVEDSYITFYSKSPYQVGQTIGVTKSYSVK